MKNLSFSKNLPMLLLKMGSKRVTSFRRYYQFECHCFRLRKGELYQSSVLPAQFPASQSSPTDFPRSQNDIELCRNYREMSWKHFIKILSVIIEISLTICCWSRCTLLGRSHCPNGRGFRQLCTRAQRVVSACKRLRTNSKRGNFCITFFFLCNFCD